MRKIDTYFLNLARQQAEKSDMHFKLGCVAVIGSTLLAAANNKFFDIEGIKNHKGLCWSSHAEEEVLRKTLKVYPELKNSKDIGLYVVRTGGRGIAKPCERCMRLIERSPVRFVVYSTEGGVEKLVV